mmetsp:Transcript_8274/g.24571  ORF Transcript_8274/g.24571 Transcript_8274/m.24571 type:complete len:443 (-) Transcript_8274:125-1453(-)
MVGVAGLLLRGSAVVAAAGTVSRQPNTSLSTIPLFAHFRYANFSPSDLALMETTLRMVTVQGTVYRNLSGEAQAGAMRHMLQLPVIVYRNLYYAEPWDASTAVVRDTPAWQLRGADGKPLNPEGKFVYNITMPRVQQFYTQVVANLSAAGQVDGAFADSGCGVRPAWLPSIEQADFAAGQLATAAASQRTLDGSGGIFIQNCPYVPRNPTGAGSDPWPAGVRGSMYESWCSDFQTGVGGPSSAEWCRYEILYLISGPASWHNGSVIQARYYLSPHNSHDPRFGAIAFLVAAFPGAFFGASTDWWWDGDWQRQSLASWASQPLGTPGPPQMLDKSGCGWSRSFGSGARVFVNLCYGKGHPLEAHAVWADNSTWPPELGVAAADARVARHVSVDRWGDFPHGRGLPAGVAVRRAAPEEATANLCRSTATLVLGVDGAAKCMSRR